MNFLSLFLLNGAILLIFKVRTGTTLPLILRTSDHCNHGFCPVTPKRCKTDPSTFHCPPRYRLNLDICLPTKSLCEDAQKHGLYCTTSATKNLSVGWFQNKRVSWRNTENQIWFDLKLHFPCLSSPQNGEHRSHHNNSPTQRPISNIITIT